jgi:diguanylate cyclase (GGDEF)-like protein
MPNLYHAQADGFSLSMPGFQASAPLPSRNILATRITGVVFWGLVVLGLTIAYMQSRNLHEDVLAQYADASNRAVIQLHQVFSQQPDISNELLQPMLTAMQADYGISGIVLDYSGKTVRSGEFSAASVVHERNFTYLGKSAPKNSLHMFTLHTYYPDPQKTVAERRKNLLITLGGLFTLFGFMLQWVLHRILTRPFMQMVNTARGISTGQANLRFQENSNDEFGFLGRFINESLNFMQRQQDEIAYDAAHDALTGLYNRREFEQRLKQALENAQKDHGHHVLAFLDLDQFKVVNDTCGHVAGDELLKQLAELMHNSIRESDFLARLGGDEMGVVFFHCSLDKAAQLCDQLRRKVQELRFSWDHRVFEMTVTTGLVAISAESESVEALMSAADMACYAAKDRGRNRIHIFHPQDNVLLRRHTEMEWVSRITSAIEEQRLCLYYQTISPIQAGSAEQPHYEILLRLIDEEGNIVLPMAFIPAAERYSLMPTIDRWVVSATLEFMRELAGNGDYPIFAINLSGHSMGDRTLLEEIIKQIETTQINPDQLCFEVTETAAIAHMASASRFIARLRDLGCHFALDDFGSGLSSFAYLKNLKVDYLKIDGCFVRDMATDKIDHSMVDAIARVGKIMGIKTIAEFVESKAILDELSMMGIDFAQGFYIGKALPLKSWQSPD